MQTPTLFQLLDENRDGRLGVRELRTAWDRLIVLEEPGAAVITRNIIQPAVAVRLSRTFERYYAQPVDPRFANPNQVQVPQKGPVWFRKMDRNGDGDVSRAEYIGTKEEFVAIDTDRLFPPALQQQIGRLDRAHSFRVSLAYGALASVSDTALFAGANVAALRGPDGAWEIIGFAEAQLVGAGAFRLSRLLRGLGGEEHLATRSLAAGADFGRQPLLGVPVALKDLGLSEDQLKQALDIALQNQYPNPRPLQREPLRELLYNAWQGERPA